MKLRANEARVGARGRAVVLSESSTGNSATDGTESCWKLRTPLLCPIARSEWRVNGIISLESNRWRTACMPCENRSARLGWARSFSLPRARKQRRRGAARGPVSATPRRPMRLGLNGRGSWRVDRRGNQAELTDRRPSPLTRSERQLPRRGVSGKWRSHINHYLPSPQLLINYL